MLPKPDPGDAATPPGAEAIAHVDEPLEQQRTPWSIWLTPRPARVKYGIDLTHALFRHMHELATLRGGRFVVLLTPSSAERRTDAPVALEHAGHWFLADPATRDAAIAEATKGLDTIVLPPRAGVPAPDAYSAGSLSPEAERNTMVRLAEALNQRAMLAAAPVDKPRH
jgi:hypothetical protein